VLFKAIMCKTYKMKKVMTTRGSGMGFFGMHPVKQKE